MICRFVAAAILLTTQAIADDIDIGRAIYTGSLDSLSSSIRGELPERQLRAFPCAGCHGRNGRGGTEGDVPAIQWTYLEEATAERDAFDLASFQLAVTGGQHPSGRALSRLMPRYQLSPDGIAALVTYLQTLPDIDARGVTARSITVCVAATGGALQAIEEYARRLKTRLDNISGHQGVYGRKIVVEILRGAPAEILAAADADCLAVLGLVADATLSVDAFSDHGIPVLFPLHRLSGTEDASIVRALSASTRDIHIALADAISKSGLRRIFIADGPSAADLLRVIRFNEALANVEVSSGTLSGYDGEPVVVILDNMGAFDQSRLPPGTELWTYAGSGMAQAAPSHVRLKFIVDAPGLVATAIANDTEPLQAHADLTASVLSEALKVNGRELGRASLVNSLEQAPLHGLGLDYERYPLTGTDEVVIVER